MTDERERDWAAIHDPASTADQLTVIGQRYPEFLPTIVARLSAPPAMGPGVAAELSGAVAPATGTDAVPRPRRATAAWIVIAALVVLWLIPGTLMGAGHSAVWVVALAVALTTATAITVLVAGVVSGRGTGRKVAAAAASFAVFWPPVLAALLVLLTGFYRDTVAVMFAGLGVAVLGVLMAWIVVVPRSAAAYWSLAVSGGVIVLVAVALWFVPVGADAAMRWVIEVVLQGIALVVVPLVCAVTLGRRPSVVG